LPMIFTSFDHIDTSFIDWWLKSNLPVLELDWDNIIAVSAVRDNWKKIIWNRKFLNFEFKKWFIWYNYEILKKTITILMSTIEDLSLELAREKWKNIIFLAPDLGKFEYYDFKKVDALVKKGYDEAKIKL
jgi:hypothetical protein